MGWFSLAIDLLTKRGAAWSKWQEERTVVRQAELEAKVASIKAKAELAVHKAAADIEWDLSWADQAKTSWKDEYILILWTIPLVIILPSLFVPGWRDYAVETLSFLQSLNPEILVWYMGGWTLIFAATFGHKAAANVMLPGKVKTIAQAYKDLPDDVPKQIVEESRRTILDVIRDLRLGNQNRDAS